MKCPYCEEEITTTQVEDGEVTMMNTEEFQGLVHRICQDDAVMEAVLE